MKQPSTSVYRPKVCLKCFLVLLFISSSILANAQSLQVLIFHKTNGYRHTGAINAGNSMIKALGTTNGWTVDDTQDPTVFNTQTLSDYSVVVWNNATGNGLLNTSQQQAFESFIRAGGGFVGIHAATDTYRNRSWPWYNNLVGAIVQTSPNHSPNNTNATMDIVEQGHPIVSHLGSTWTKKEEWFYWEKNGGWLYSGNNVLLKVRSTGSNSYDAERPITWYKEYDGGRSFYTALGHNGSDYVANSDFGKLIENGILWAGQKISTSIFENNETSIKIYPNPASNDLFVFTGSLKATVTLYNISGKKLLEVKALSDELHLDISNLPRGLYFIKLDGEQIQKTEKILLK